MKFEQDSQVMRIVEQFVVVFVILFFSALLVRTFCRQHRCAIRWFVVFSQMQEGMVEVIAPFVQEYAGHPCEALDEIVLQHAR